MISQATRDLIASELKLQNREMKEVSLEAGLGESYVRDALKRGRGKIENLIKVAQVLGHPAEWLLQADRGALAGVKPAAPPTRPAREPSNAQGREPAPIYGSPLDVLGVSRGGEDGKLIFNGDVIETVPRPPELEGVDGAYASYVTGVSMAPRFKEGERVWVHPRRPPRRGNDVIVQVLAEDARDPPEGYIKEYVGYSGGFLVLTQHNPAREVKFPRDEVVSVHVIVGSLFA